MFCRIACVPTFSFQQFQLRGTLCPGHQECNKCKALLPARPSYALCLQWWGASIPAKAIDQQQPTGYAGSTQIGSRKIRPTGERYVNKQPVFYNNALFQKVAQNHFWQPSAQSTTSQTSAVVTCHQALDFGPFPTCPQHPTSSAWHSSNMRLYQTL
eukprot:1157548-Pelagomonas_calceolata.AAC.5